jgi:hypothetical protein
MNPWIVLPGLVVVAVVFVMLPVGLAVFRHYSRPKVIRCPVTGDEAAIQIDADGAAVRAALGQERLEVLDCSAWPQERCAQRCVIDAIETMREEPTGVAAAR